MGRARSGNLFLSIDKCTILYVHNTGSAMSSCVESAMKQPFLSITFVPVGFLLKILSFLHIWKLSFRPTKLMHFFSTFDILLTQGTWKHQRAFSLSSNGTTSS